MVGKFKSFSLSNGLLSTGLSFSLSWRRKLIKTLISSWPKASDILACLWTIPNVPIPPGIFKPKRRVFVWTVWPHHGALTAVQKKDNCPTIARGNGHAWDWLSHKLVQKNPALPPSARQGHLLIKAVFFVPAKSSFYFILFYINPLQEPTTQASAGQIRSSVSAAVFFILLDTRLPRKRSFGSSRMGQERVKNP